MVEAFQDEDFPTLEKLTRGALKASPTVGELRQSGATHLLRDDWVWQRCDEPSQKNVALALEKWQAIEASAPAAKECHPHPSGPLRAQGFQQACSHFLKFLLALMAIMPRKPLRW